MKARILMLAVILLAAVAFTSAQTVYTQSTPQTCQITDYVCNHIPLEGGGYYSFVAGYDHIYVGAHFTLSVGGTTTFGSVTEIVTQAPSLHVDGAGPFEFKFGLADGRTGDVSGQITVLGTKWHYAIVESSTVTTNP